MSQESCPEQRLARFSMQQQHYGTYFSQFAWQLIGCGTFRDAVNEDKARQLFSIYIDRLSRQLGVLLLGHIGVLERRFSGLGQPASHFHWHFVLAAPDHMREALVQSAIVQWEAFGECRIERYDAQRSGACYLAKGVRGDSFVWVFCLDRMTYDGPGDLFAQQQGDPFVPEHAQPYARLETLAMRPVSPKERVAKRKNTGPVVIDGKTGLPIQSRNRGGQHGRSW